MEIDAQRGVVGLGLLRLFFENEGGSTNGGEEEVVIINCG